MIDPLTHRCGYVALLGRPNVGKSTLLNAMLGQKLSIISRKPQTTRHRILGIKTTPAAQLLFVDTPGIHRDRRRALNRYMNRAATDVIAEVDVVVLVLEASRFNEEDLDIATRLREVSRPIVVAINKIDRLKARQSLLPYIDTIRDRIPSEEIVPVSGLSGENISQLEASIMAHLPCGPRLFAEDQYTDRTERFLAAELIREKLTERLGDELPFSLSVEIEQFRERPSITHIGAVIWVERNGQKAIVIGKQGRALKWVGASARKELEELLGARVHLELWVKVRAGWSDDPRALKQFGYE